MASPVRSCCWQSSGPVVATITSWALPASLDAQRFFQRDFVEGVYAHFDAVCDDARAIGLYPYTDVVVDNPFYANKNFVHI